MGQDARCLLLAPGGAQLRQHATVCPGEDGMVEIDAVQQGERESFQSSPLPDNNADLTCLDDSQSVTLYLVSTILLVVRALWRGVSQSIQIDDPSVLEAKIAVILTTIFSSIIFFVVLVLMAHVTYLHKGGLWTRTAHAKSTIDDDSSRFSPGTHYTSVDGGGGFSPESYYQPQPPPPGYGVSPDGVQQQYYQNSYQNYYQHQYQYGQPPMQQAYMQTSPGNDTLVEAPSASEVYEAPGAVPPAHMLDSGRDGMRKDEPPTPRAELVQ